jgi:hypothetical protein
MAHMLVIFPTTSIKVQHWLNEDRDAPPDAYEMVICPACKRVHFINQKTGKLLGQGDK